MLCLYMVMQNSTLKQAEESLVYFIEDYENKKRALVSLEQHNWRGCAAG